jgi:hypothetical protein
MENGTPVPVASGPGDPTLSEALVQLPPPVVLTVWVVAVGGVLSRMRNVCSVVTRIMLHHPALYHETTSPRASNLIAFAATGMLLLAIPGNVYALQRHPWAGRSSFVVAVCEVLHVV